MYRVKCIFIKWVKIIIDTFLFCDGFIIVNYYYYCP